MVDSAFSPGAGSGLPVSGRLYRFLDENGNDTGNKNANGDYSGVNNTEFFILCPAGFIYLIHRIIIHITDVGNPDSGKYGNNITLTNGINIEVLDSDDNVLEDLTDGFPVKTNADWGRFSYDVQDISFGSGDSSVGCRWSFDKAGDPITLKPGERFAVMLNDDFSGLVEHTFHIQGLIKKRLS